MKQSVIALLFIVKSSMSFDVITDASQKTFTMFHVV